VWQTNLLDLIRFLFRHFFANNLTPMFDLSPRFHRQLIDIPVTVKDNRHRHWHHFFSQIRSMRPLSFHSRNNSEYRRVSLAELMPPEYVPHPIKCDLNERMKFYFPVKNKESAVTVSALKRCE